MKHVFLPAILLSSALFSSLAAAEFHSLSLSYAQSEVRHYEDIQGASFQYRYECDDAQLGLITSFNWLQGESREARLKRFSWMAGPAWRINDVVSFYALAGASWNRVRGDYYGHDSDQSFAWGMGVQFNPQPDIVLEAGYQGGKIVDSSSHGFTVGAGYRF